MVKAKKSFGQHFLNDHRVLLDIVDAFPDMPDATIVEVGPGRGALTRLLLDKYGERPYAVELDNDLIPVLRKMFPQLGDRLIHEDFLKLDMRRLPDGPIILCGNFPYNISSQILFKALDFKDRIDCIVGMFQKEVSDRVISGPGKKDYGILSVLLKAWYNGSEVVVVPPEAFTPPPKVFSSVIKLERNGVEQLPCNEKVFKTVVKLSFNQRRKMMRNSLKSLVKDESLLEHEMFTRRPEQMSLEDYFQLTQMIEAQ